MHILHGRCVRSLGRPRYLLRRPVLDESSLAIYQGTCEVETFSARDWWRRDPDEVVRVILERYGTAV